MGSKKIRPVTPGMRGQVSTDFKDITKKKPEKSLLQSKKSSGGRNNKGRITSRHRGGGHKQKYRIIDFKRVKDGIPARVAGIEYDPNRNASRTTSKPPSPTRSTSAPPPTSTASPTPRPPARAHAAHR